MQGYVDSFDAFHEGKKIEYLLISRRSKIKGGTRFYDRGVNENGYVANFVLTEQIVKVDNYLMSDIQIRGNVPVFFEQKGLTTKIKITRGLEMTHRVF